MYDLKLLLFFNMATQPNEYYMIISSNDYDEIYPLNNNTSFTIDLPTTLNLENDWEISLTEMWFKSTLDNRNEMDICTDICVESLVNGKFIQFLRRIVAKKGYNNVRFTNRNYFLVNRSQLKNITFYITLVQQINASFLRGKVTLQLHLRKRRI